jgi:hypothetical protein
VHLGHADVSSRSRDLPVAVASCQLPVASCQLSVASCQRARPAGSSSTGNRQLRNWQLQDHPSMPGRCRQGRGDPLPDHDCMHINQWFHTIDTRLSSALAAPIVCSGETWKSVFNGWLSIVGDDDGRLGRRAPRPARLMCKLAGQRFRGNSLVGVTTALGAGLTRDPGPIRGHGAWGL